MSQAEPPESAPEASADPPDGHHDDGLELARAAARRAQQMPLSKRRRRPAGGGAQTGRRGTRPRVSGAFPDERDPQLIGSVVDRIVGEQGWGEDLRVRGVFARWPELVGPQVAEHARPESFADGRLVVRTDSTAWATQLRLLAPTVVRRLNEELGHGTITFLEIQGPAVPSWTKGRRSVPGRGPRDTYG